LAALALSAVLMPCARAGDYRHFEDAALHAVQFWDRKEGWAVGDEGVVWHTIDSGQNWERQATGVRASLRSLHFLSPYVGWVVGREELPGHAGSTGTILFTRDGGLTWRHASRNTMPGLNHVRFVDAKTGFVVGDGTDQFPTGVFRTLDGGRTWQPIQGPRCPGWLAADFSDDKTGALVGRWNRLGTLSQGALGAADVDLLGGRNVHSLFLTSKLAFAVGQGGLILRSENAGVRWGVVDPKLSADIRACWDFRAIHGEDGNLWIAGRPGSALLHSADAGKTWEIQTTGQRLPLNGVFFKDARNGWAVGELGSILGTCDGGKSWKVQRRGGQRAAVLFAHARSSELPVDVLANLGGQEGYLAASLCVMAPDPASAWPALAADPELWEAASNRAAGAAAETLWQFPMPEHLGRIDRAALVKYWDRMHGDHAADQLLRQMVLALRIWQPSVVITDHPDSAVTGSAADAVIAEAMHEAFARAADARAFPEQLESLGLEVWQAGKLYSAWDKRANAQVIFDSSEVSNILQDTYRSFATPAANLLTERVPALPGMRLYHLLDSNIEGAAQHRNLMDGTALVWDGPARRKQTDAKPASAEMMQAINRRKMLEALAENSAGSAVDPEKLLAQLGPSLGQMPEDQAAAAAFGIATQYARQGQWTLAREIFLLLVDSYPTHPLAADACRWLVKYNCSSEAQRRHELGHFVVVSNLSYEGSPNTPKLQTPSIKVEGKNAGVSDRAPTQRFSPSERHSAQVPHVEVFADPGTAVLGHLRNLKEARNWYEGSLKFGERLAAFGPLYATDPSLHFCLNASRRNLGQLDEASDWYRSFRDTHNSGPWRDAAAAELWLRDRDGPCPKPLATCRLTSERPFLDANFDDACWKSQKPIVLKNAVGNTAKEYPTEAILSFDHEYLYIAVKCGHPADGFVPTVKARKRDEDLRAHDRICLLLDLDRDYATYYRLEVDQRGCLFEDCWGDRTWNPRWFVAARGGPEGWRVEAAIPLTELTGERLSVGKAWACNVVRVLPGRGVQALSLPADVEPRPEGMGILLFMPEQQPRLQPTAAGN
jgi:photosystem II stability/assembly factor-like uncharacterized protein